MKYKYTELTEEVTIHRIISIHYFEYMSDFTFAGESHNFWELLCVDKGEVDVVADHERLTLQKGDVIFHQPNEFHRVLANGVIAPNLVVIGFDCQSPRMTSFKEQILKVGQEEQELLARIIAEARLCFDGRLDNPYQEVLVRKEHGPFAAEQVIKIYLEIFLIQMYRRAFSARRAPALHKDIPSAEDIYETILLYFEKNISTQLTIDQISRDNLISTSQLKKLFFEKGNTGVIEYFNGMKIDAAKQLIRNRQLNFTQIANQLGYSSVHYFSRQFKHLTGMTPTEYATSIKKLSDKNMLRNPSL
ncbi:AraC family transcriptional regulator [Lacrimispora sp.]|jgi:AraC-like DNA-binding protein|uniref:AraC family transcriptional regulator n=1 Tax=Lacrimispora sp. TaxID=2719234 RepID=UPI0028A5C164|nr:AraC family transcriptional regulator [Lacrimispora sp.]